MQTKVEKYTVTPGPSGALGGVFSDHKQIAVDSAIQLTRKSAKQYEVWMRIAIILPGEPVVVEHEQ